MPVGQGGGEPLLRRRLSARPCHACLKKSDINWHAIEHAHHESCDPTRRHELSEFGATLGISRQRHFKAGLADGLHEHSISTILESILEPANRHKAALTEPVGTCAFPLTCLDDALLSPNSSAGRALHS